MIVLPYRLRKKFRRFRLYILSGLSAVSGKLFVFCLVFCGTPLVLLWLPILARRLLLPAGITPFPFSAALYLPLWTLHALLPGAGAAAHLSSGAGDRLKRVGTCVAAYWCCLLRLPLLLCGAGPALLFFCSFLTCIAAAAAVFPGNRTSAAASLFLFLFAFSSLFFFFCDILLFRIC